MGQVDGRPIEMAQDNAFVKLWQTEERRALEDLQNSDENFDVNSRDFRFLKQVMETRRKLVKASREHIVHNNLDQAIEADEDTGIVAAE